ncbi:MAG: Gfo/Idh/MocA family oxidoreductase [Desulfobacterales bacterium]
MKTKSNKSNFTRREFMSTAGLGAASVLTPLAFTSCKSNSTTVAIKDRPAAAVIGLGNRGRSIASFQFSPYMDVIAICDVDRRRAQVAAEELLKRTGRKVSIYQDYRNLLEREDIDIIANATPQHWHAKITIDACRAGKDVYSEKPLTLTIDESQILKRVAKETGRIIQVGTQQRSASHFRAVASLVRNGRIGKLKQVAVILPSRYIDLVGHDVGPCVPVPVPPELNWDMWCGPGPLIDYTGTLSAHYSWDFYGGLVCEWGGHHIDIANWGIGAKETVPLTIEGEGYSPNLDKLKRRGQFSPFCAKLEYPDDIDMWIMSAYPSYQQDMDSETREIINRTYRNLPDNIRNFNMPDPDGGILFIGESGTVFVGRFSVISEEIGEIFRIPSFDNVTRSWQRLWEFSVSFPAHTIDFVNCVQTRQQPVSNVFEEHYSQLPMHLVNIALRCGRKLEWDAKAERFVNDAEANGHLKYDQREPYQIV